jgi:transglutaminase-like putative cysteine protease
LTQFSKPLSVRLVCAVVLLCAFGATPVRCQAPASSATKQATKSPDASQKAPELPAQIELLETRVRFEANGDSRKEVHTRVHINNEVGARQFARLTFDYNRSFQQIEFPLVRITHAGGGTVDILPSAISDQPNPAVVNAPAYQDVRVKSARILGLAPGDILEYRVITTTSHHPLAPDFWLDHTFDRSGVTANEIFELDLPTSHIPEMRINPGTPAASIQELDEGDATRTIYRWEQTNTHAKPRDSIRDASTEADVVISTLGWEPLSIRLDERLSFEARTLLSIGAYEEPHTLPTTRDVTPEIATKALQLTKGLQTHRAKLEAIYDFVSRINTVDLPLGATGFVPRPASEVLANGYATQEDKFILFAVLASAVKLNAGAALTGYCDAKGLGRPSVFKHLLISTSDGKSSFWLDPSLEVAPFGVVPPSSGKCAFVLYRFFFVMNSNPHEWQPLDVHLPFASRQRVNVDAAISTDGTLSTKVKYAMRGDNELLLRVAFHQSPKEKWNEVAQLLALSDGFRGKITNVTASDPYATKAPFTVEYEITQPKFVDWAKKPVRIPALLPQLGLPDAPGNRASGAATAAIDLGTPLDVETHLTLRLPPGTAALTPTGTSVERDYATFASKYQEIGDTVTASRRLNFLLREVSADRIADYNAFLRAVQNDEAQEFTLERRNVASAQPAAETPRKKN